MNITDYSNIQLYIRIKLNGNGGFLWIKYIYLQTRELSIYICIKLNENGWFLHRLRVNKKKTVQYYWSLNNVFTDKKQRDND